MKKQKLNTVLLFSILFSVLLTACNSKENNTAVKKTKKTPVVKIQSAVQTKMVSFIEIIGTIEANIYSEIKSPVDGVIEDLFARENQQVESGQVIAVINPNDRLSLISNNQLQVQKLEKQLKMSDKSIKEYAQLKQSLKEAKSNLEYAKDMYQTSPVICPINGIVTQRWLDKGSQVTAKEKVLTITDMNSLVVKAEVNEKYFEAIKQSRKLAVILNAYPSDTLTGVISLVYPQINPETRSVEFDVKIQNFNKKLLPGMMASIQIPVAVNENAIAVNTDAVLISPDNKQFLFVVNKDSIAIKRIVKTGIASGSLIEICKGISEHEIVVVMGQEVLKDSVKVKVMGTPKSKKK
jgi:multidrug efflux pump subunit AcrA (membrane-fusion protein)